MFQKRPIRRGQLISPWGIGNMINFPDDESLMVAGLDVWPFSNESCPDDMKLREERLEKRLDVNQFRLPPEYREPSQGVENPSLCIPCIRFPQWHYCPKCGGMEKISIYGSKQKCKGPVFVKGMTCHGTQPKKRPWLIPVRFVAICKNGHIEDFPFIEWLHRHNNYDADCQLRLQAGRSSSSLSGMLLSCRCGCNVRSLAGAFNHNSLNIINKKCSGLRPWLGEIGDEVEPCGENLQVVQRGASNVYFPHVASSIYLPRWDDNVERRVIEVLEKNWETLTSGRVDGELNRARFETIAELKGIDCEKLLEAALKRLNKNIENEYHQEYDKVSEEEYRKSEYEAIISGAGGDNQDFFVINKNRDNYDSVVRKFFKSISLLHKLRETRALIGFSRLLPEDGKSLSEKKAQLALNNSIRWLPAIVVKGEGVFFEFDFELIKEWQSKESVKKRVSLLADNYNKIKAKRGLPERHLNAKFVLLHTFSHVLINQLSFDCGYGSSAIRERIYCNSDSSEEAMNGVLIYTASGDSEGSLGGLVRQGTPGYLEDIVLSAFHSARWCSSDPVCMNSRGQGPDSCNLAACHGCALLPETSCEEGNRMLDRVLLVGTPEQPETGYFFNLD